MDIIYSLIWDAHPTRTPEHGCDHRKSQFGGVYCEAAEKCERRKTRTARSSQVAKSSQDPFRSKWRSKIQEPKSSKTHSVSQIWSNSCGSHFCSAVFHQVLDTKNSLHFHLIHQFSSGGMRLQVYVGEVPVGSEHPIATQTMRETQPSVRHGFPVTA